MSEETAEDNSPPSTSQDNAPTRPYPARDSENGEEQKNRLGYMVTDPTEDEIEGEDGKTEEKPTETSKAT
ncbi:MAG: hypothetical protein V4671_03630 [Armatimonadota bacterium]